MTVEIPLRSDLPHFSLSCELDKRSFLLEFRWNARDAAWFFSIFKTDDTPILVGRKLVVDFPMRFRFVSADLPDGEFVAVDTSGQSLSPGLGDLGARVLLYYTSAG